LGHKNVRLYSLEEWIQGCGSIISLKNMVMVRGVILYWHETP
nr:hypothetical protein [Tanacetum cinerariifolium]